MPTKKATKKAPAKKAAVKKVAKKAVKKKVVKKTAKKAAPKKVAKKATKKVVKKTAKKATKSTKKSLIVAADQESFWVNNGQVLNSLIALRDALDEMEKEVYSYHAGGAHNDFAIWVDKVLSDNKCATDLQKARTPRTAKTVVVKHLKFYSI